MCLALLMLAGTVPAATLVSGSAQIDFDKAAWDSLAAGIGVGQPVLTLDEYFDQTAANQRTPAKLLNDEVQANPSYTGQIYLMNGTTVSNAPGRTSQPTTFTFTPGQIQGHTGSIGLGGVARFRVAAAAGGGRLLYGDYTLLYDADRASLGNSGWVLMGNIAPAGAAFDLLNVSVIETPSSLTISGNLGVTFEYANLLYATPSDEGRNVGHFTFTALVVVPEPTTGSLFLLGLAAGGCVRLRSRRRC